MESCKTKFSKREKNIRLLDKCTNFNNNTIKVDLTRAKQLQYLCTRREGHLTIRRETNTCKLHYFYNVIHRKFTKQAKRKGKKKV